jgi:hypothetical protein
MLGNFFKRAASQLQQKKQAQPQKRMQPRTSGAFGALGGLLGSNAWGSRKYNAMNATQQRQQLKNRKRGCM